MLKSQTAKFTLLLSLTFLIVAFSCESPQQTSPQPKPILASPIPDNQSLNVGTSVDQPESLKQKIVETYARYWPLISSEHQHNQLPEVLGDKMPELRVFGIERVGVLLRDGEATNEELQLVVDRLTDSNSTVRLAAAKLLPEIDVPGLAEHVANAIAQEVDIEVAEQELIYFQTVSHPNAIPPTIDRLLQNPNGAAADALIFLLNNNDVSEKIQRQILRAVLKSRQQSSLPSLITLEAMLGSNTTKRALIKMLDNPNDSVREAVAMGFAYAGFAEPLIARADDPLLYTYALAALQKKVDIDSFKELLDVRKDNEPNWNAAAFSIATSLSTSELLRADDMLKRLNLDELRLTILHDVWKNASQKSIAARKAIARRAVPLMISRDDAVGALQLLGVFGESLIDDDLITLRFVAAIDASAWDAAADARPDPALWITQWERVKVKDQNAASVIKKQIIQRYNDQLTQKQKTLLGIAPSITPPDNTP
ncbi:MAG: hypothetical protein H8E86_05820 [Planctomycetes bacterium]|nr:hypothetical protein [Planctomycetota bacterium]